MGIPLSYKNYIISLHLRPSFLQTQSLILKQNFTCTQEAQSACTEKTAKPRYCSVCRLPDTGQIEK